MNSGNSVDPASVFLALPRGFRFAAIGAAMLVMCLVAVSYILNPGDKSPYLVPAFCFALLAGCLPLFQLRSDSGWLHPLVFTAIMSTTALLRKMPIYLAGLSTHQALRGVSAEHLNSLAAYELFLTGLGSIAYLVGYWALRGIIVKPSKPHQACSVPLKSVLAVVIAIAFFAVYVGGKGGLIAHIHDWSHRSVKLEAQGIWQPFTALGVSACILWASFDVRCWRSPAFWACMAVSLVIHFLTFASRGQLIFSASILLAIRMLRDERMRYFAVTLVVLVSVVALGVLGNFRRSTWQKESIDWKSLQSFDPIEVISNDVVGEVTERATTFSPTLAILAKVPDRVPLLMGESYLAVLALPVPRMFWPEKPRLIARRTGETFLKLVAGTPPGQVGEAYWNFHVPGVVLYFLLFGALHRWLAQWYLANSRRSYGPAFFAVALILLRGDTSSIPVWLNLQLGMLAMVPLFALGTRKKEAGCRASGEETGS